MTMKCRRPVVPKKYVACNLGVVVQLHVDYVARSLEESIAPGAVG